jgi:hypothetical protein
MTEPSRRAALYDVDDLVVVERQQDGPRALEGMQGVYSLDGWRDAKDSSREFACEILKISPHTIKMLVPLTGTVGTNVTVEFEHLGKFEGPIIQVLPRALVMKIIGTNEERARVASRLAWITDSDRPEARRFPRMVPVNPESVVALPGGFVLPCDVIDYSCGGVAVYADATPVMGSVVKIGTVLSRVVRHFGGGFAVAFMTVQPSQCVETSILQPALRPAES